MSNFVFIAVNYNGSDYSLKYVESVNGLARSENDNISIILVDNESQLSDYEKLQEGCKNIANVTLIRSETNLGYFGGLNLGIKAVPKAPDTLLIVGNNDLTFDRGFILNLKKIEITSEVFALAPNIITMEGRQQNPHVVEKYSQKEKIKTRLYYSNYYIGQMLHLANHFIKRFSRTDVPSKNNYGQMKIKAGIGACYVLTHNFTDKFDLLDASVFMWGEEAVFAHQVESGGGIILYDPTIIIYHHESASVKTIESKRRYFMVKESYKIYRKYL